MIEEDLKKIFGKYRILRNSTYNYKIIHDGGFAKLDIFADDHYKYSKSLPVHQMATEKNIQVPHIIAVFKYGGKTYKVSRWIEGTVLEKLRHDGGVFSLLGEYIHYLHSHGIEAVDNHLRNFVYSNDGKIYYIDSKKLWLENNHFHTVAKLLIKNIRDRNNIVKFLQGYIKHADVTPIMEICDSLNWQWVSAINTKVSMDRIKFEDLVI